MAGGFTTAAGADDAAKAVAGGTGVVAGTRVRSALEVVDTAWRMCLAAGLALACCGVRRFAVAVWCGGAAATGRLEASAGAVFRPSIRPARLGASPAPPRPRA